MVVDALEVALERDVIKSTEDPRRKVQDLALVIVRSKR